MYLSASSMINDQGLLQYVWPWYGLFMMWSLFLSSHRRFCNAYEHHLRLLKYFPSVYVSFERPWFSYYSSIRDHSFSKYAKFSQKVTFLTPWYASVRVQIMGVRNVSFWENFAHAINEWLLKRTWISFFGIRF